MPMNAAANAAATLTLAVLISALVPSGEAHALSYKVKNDAEGKRVLLAYDCGFIKNDPQCPEVHDASLDGFNDGEELRFRNELAKGPFAEVWLLSGGGALNAGIALAREFYARAQTVRVPNIARLRGAGLEPEIGDDGRPLTRCISSCTVAFMGGQFRFIDLQPGDEATYEVHAGSLVSWGNLKDEQTKESIADFTARAHKDLAELARWLAMRNHARARELFKVFQDSLWLVLKKRDSNDPERQSRDRALGTSRSLAYQYTASQLTRDQDIIRLEGGVALQDVLMRIERESMQSAIDELRRDLPSLGRRADTALAIVEAMYGTSSILETNRMPRETLLKMGYITEFITQP